MNDQTCEIKEMKIKAKEIIDLSQQRLLSGNISSQNKLVIKAILNEFQEILNFLESNNKLLLCAPERPINTRWVIIDSADFDNAEDNELFDKVRGYNEACSKIEERYKLYTESSRY